KPFGITGKVQNEGLSPRRAHESVGCLLKLSVRLQFELQRSIHVNALDGGTDQGPRGLRIGCERASDGCPRQRRQAAPGASPSQLPGQPVRRHQRQNAKKPTTRVLASERDAFTAGFFLQGPNPPWMVIDDGVWMAREERLPSCVGAQVDHHPAKWQVRGFWPQTGFTREARPRSRYIVGHKVREGAGRQTSLKTLLSLFVNPVRKAI